MAELLLEIYKVILVDLNTKEILPVQVEVDEAETTENITIHAVIGDKDIIIRGLMMKMVLARSKLSNG